MMVEFIYLTDHIYNKVDQYRAILVTPDSFLDHG